MKRSLLAVACLALLIGMLTTSPVCAQLGARVSNWSVPNTSGRSHALGIESDIGFGGTALVPVTPCRIVDTRGPVGTFGGPALAPGSPRNFPLLSGPCTGLPPAVLAYSLNITATDTAGTGFFKVFPQGGSSPVVSTLNYVAGQTVANAAIVPAGAGGGITVAAGVAGADLLIDINGYFVGNGSLAPLNPNEYVGWQGSYPGSGIAFGWNTSASAGSSGVRGLESNNGSSVSGVQGEVGGISFVGPFLHGSEGVTGINTFSGVLGLSMDRSVVGVLLNSTGTDLAEGWSGKSGSNATTFFGVEGVLISTTAGPNSAGVFGQDVGGFSGGGVIRAGVRGDSRTSAGVIGTSLSRGVAGLAFDTTGASIVEGDLGLASGPWGVFAFGNIGATGTKPFVEVHPTDASKEIRYVALEGPEAGTYFRGTAETHNGMAVILVPENFRMVTDVEGLTVQLTAVGAPASMYVVSQDLNQIVVHSSRDVRFHYMVNGVRATFKDWQVVKETEFMPESPTQTIPGYFSAAQKQRLIANGTYNADGTVNMDTARRLGWDRVWEARAEELRKSAAMSEALSSDQSTKSREPISK